MADVAAAPPHDALFGVTASAAGRRWVLRGGDVEGLADEHARQLGLPQALGRVLAARGIKVGEGEAYLSPSLKAALPDPSRFADMDQAAGLLADAIEQDRRIAVFADYDVDGATSAAQLIRYLRARDRGCDLYVPDRIVEGYGPSGQAFSALKNRGAEVVVTVDCGAMAHEALGAARDMGLQVIVLDHHQMTASLPPAAAVVNPNRPDCQSGAGHMAAAGVTFMALVALNRECRRRGHFAGGVEPDLKSLLDLTALGTICDVVALRGVNRAIAAQGLKVMSQRANPGIAALGEVAGMKEGPASTYTAGFLLGPRINAGGRVGQADLGAQLLSTDDPLEAARIARQLDTFNTERRAIEAAVLEEASAKVESDPALREASVLTVAGEGWHPGVIGVVASRLKERYARPTMVIGLDPAGEEPGRGSGRSVTGVDLGAAVAAARDAGLLIAGGGHAMAAGLTVASDKVAAVSEALSAHVDAAGPLPEPTLHIDAALSAMGVTREFADILERAAPFGAGNPEPVFAVADLRVASFQFVGADASHLRVTLESAGGERFTAIAFRAEERGLAALLTVRDAKVHAAVKIKPGRGRYVDVHLEDAARA